MRPAWSVILFTTLAGAGQGLFLALFAAEVLADPEWRFLVAGAALALALLGAGLAASFFHLGHPERAWRSAAMWRTSWLSREVIVLPAFMGVVVLFGAAHLVGWKPVVASLPSANASQTDSQRGEGVFERSISALRALNRVGYGVDGSGLTLNLVANPVGAFLPPKQVAIEAQVRRELERRHGVVFNNLYTITNMPISRFLEFLIESGNFEGYMERLANAFNPAAAKGVMCRDTISVGWDGTLYDCDFNQMLNLPIADDSGRRLHIASLTLDQLSTPTIAVGDHCYACTAGAGSSCGGTLV